MRCDQCPVAAGRPCLGESGGAFAYMCEFAAGSDPVKRRHVVDRSAIAEAPPAAPPMPGLLAQAASFVKAAAGHVAAGMPTVGAEVEAARLAICSTCDHFRGDRRCTLCGCRMDIKAGWADMACPLDPPKWGRGDAT